VVNVVPVKHNATIFYISHVTCGFKGLRAQKIKFFLSFVSNFYLMCVCVCERERERESVYSFPLNEKKKSKVKSF